MPREVQVLDLALWSCSDAEEEEELAGGWLVDVLLKINFPFIDQKVNGGCDDEVLLFFVWPSQQKCPIYDFSFFN